MTDKTNHADEYDNSMVTILELVWGKGHMAPGGTDNIRKLVNGLDLSGKKVLDIGCGLGGSDLFLAKEFGAEVIGVDLEAPLVARAKGYAREAGLEDQVDFQLVTAGPFKFADETFDVVMSSGAYTQTKDKKGIFTETLRVLKPGGTMTCYEWMKPTGTLSREMLHWFELEGLTYELETIEAHLILLQDIGFINVAGKDDQGWYAEEAPRELELITGALKERIVEALGQEKFDHFVEDWRVMVGLLSRGELLPGFLRATKPT